LPKEPEWSAQKSTAIGGYLKSEGLREMKVLERANFKFPVIWEVYDYWLSKVSDGHLVKRTDIKPKDLCDCLPYLLLVDVIQNPVSFRFRLVGTRLVQWARTDHTGLILRDGEYGSDWQGAFADFCKVAHTHQPLHGEEQAPWMSKKFYRFERIITPLSTDGRNVDMLFCAFHLLEYSHKTQ
jgi:hypothetical protein